MSLDNITINKIVTKLNFLKGARIENPFQIYDGVFLLPTYLDDDMFRNPKIIISLKHENPFLSFTTSKYQKVVNADGFVSHLQKLQGSIVSGIRKIPGERIVIISLETKSIEFPSTNVDIIIELFPLHSNILIVDTPGQKILAVYKPTSDITAERFLHTNQPYRLPICKYSEIAESDSKEELQGKLPRKLFRRLENEPNLQLLMTEMLADPNIYKIENEIVPFHFASSEVINIYHLDKIFLDDQEKIIKEKKYFEIKKVIEKNLNYSQKKKNNIERDLLKAHDNLVYKDYGNALYQVINDLVLTTENSVIVDGVIIKINPLLSVSQNANNYFKTYKKAKKAIDTLELMIKDVSDEIEYYSQKLREYNDADGRDIEELRNELIVGDTIKSSKFSSKRKEKMHKQIPHYFINENVKIGFGKTGLQNEYLTFTQAQKSDLFFHVVSSHGPHVILFSSPTKESILFACELCLYFSKLQSGEVYCCEKKYVKKNPSHIGLVNLLKFETIRVSTIRETTISLLKTI